MPVKSKRDPVTRTCLSMRKVLDIAGQRFGRRVALERTGTSSSGSPIWRCLCDCGKETAVTSDSLRRGGSKSCGCLKAELSSARMKELHAAGSFQKHGHSVPKKSPEYMSWCGMQARCNNPNSSDWQLYGGRGITICERWKGEHGFENFLADMGPRPAGKTIERKNNNGNYEPGNCIWATAQEQRMNQGHAEVLPPLFQQKNVTPTLLERGR